MASNMCPQGYAMGSPSRCHHSMCTGWGVHRRTEFTGVHELSIQERQGLILERYFCLGNTTAISYVLTSMKSKEIKALKGVR